jgi:hypothetical protein
MRKPVRPLLPLTLGLVLLLGAVQSPADSVGLRLMPATTFAGPGDVVSLGLFIDGLGAANSPSLGDFDIDIAFDPLARGFVGYELGTFLGDFDSGEALDFSDGNLGNGVINLAVTSLLETDEQSCMICIEPYLDAIQPDSFLLSTLDFAVLNLPPGASTVLSINAVNALGDGFGEPLTVGSTSDAVITNPAVIPLPASLWLFASALAWLGWLARGAKRP